MYGFYRERHMFAWLCKKESATIPLRDVSSALSRSVKRQFSGDALVLLEHFIDVYGELHVTPARATEALLLAACQSMFQRKGLYHEMVRVNPSFIVHMCAVAQTMAKGPDSGNYSQELVHVAESLCSHIVYYLRSGISARAVHGKAYIGELSIPLALYEKYYRKTP